MRTAMLFHYDLDLAAVHRKIGGNHVGAHRNPEIILHQVEGLLDQKTMSTFIAYFVKDVLMYLTKKLRTTNTWKCTNTEITSPLSRTLTRSC
jgi:hypothetical protein